jgi:hypothetical protein
VSVGLSIMTVRGSVRVEPGGSVRTIVVQDGEPLRGAYWRTPGVMGFEKDVPSRAARRRFSALRNYHTTNYVCVSSPPTALPWAMLVNSFHQSIARHMLSTE